MRPHVERDWIVIFLIMYGTIHGDRISNNQGCGSVSALVWQTEFGSALKSGDLGAQKMETGRAVDAHIGGVEAQSLAVGIQNVAVMGL